MHLINVFYMLSVISHAQAYAYVGRQLSIKCIIFEKPQSELRMVGHGVRTRNPRNDSRTLSPLFHLSPFSLVDQPLKNAQ